MSQSESKERCLVCRQPVGVGEGGSMLGAMRGHTMYPVGHLCKVCKEQALRDAEPQHEDEDEDEDGSSCAMGDEFTRFLADPTVHGLAGALDEPGYGLRVGVLFGAGRITAGEARRLLLGHEADWPAGVPDDERHAARAPEGQEEEEEDGSSARNRDGAAQRRRQVALNAEQDRLLWLYHDYLRRCGFAVCRRKAAAPGALGSWAPVGSAAEQGGKQLVAHFARWLEQQERAEPAEGSPGSPREEGDGG